MDVLSLKAVSLLINMEKIIIIFLGSLIILFLDSRAQIDTSDFQDSSLQLSDTSFQDLEDAYGWDLWDIHYVLAKKYPRLSQFKLERLYLENVWEKEYGRFGYRQYASLGVDNELYFFSLPIITVENFNLGEKTCFLELAYWIYQGKSENSYQIDLDSVEIVKVQLKIRNYQKYPAFEANMSNQIRILRIQESKEKWNPATRMKKKKHLLSKNDIDVILRNENSYLNTNKPLYVTNFALFVTNESHGIYGENLFFLRVTNDMPLNRNIINPHKNTISLIFRIQTRRVELFNGANF